MGDLYSDQGKYKDAIAAYQKAIELNPNYTNAYNSLGWSYLLQGEFELAKANFEQAIQLDPAGRSPVLNLGLVYARQGQQDEAIGKWQQGLALLETDMGETPGLWDRATHALYVLALGEPEQGIREIQAAISEGASLPALKDALGDAEILAQCPLPPAGIEQMLELLRTRIAEG